MTFKTETLTFARVKQKMPLSYRDSRKFLQKGYIEDLATVRNVKIDVQRNCLVTLEGFNF